jgi:hypothetical protein
MKKLVTDRSRCEAKQRCGRSRWLGYESGDSRLGLTPVKKSIHLVIGGAVHSGLEVLLREGQQAVDNLILVFGAALQDNSVTAVLDSLMPSPAMRGIEDAAVGAALTHLRSMTEHGVELDTLELVGTEKAAQEVAQQASAITGDKLSLESMGMIEVKLTDDPYVVGLSQGFTPESTVGEVFGGEVKVVAPSEDWAMPGAGANAHGTAPSSSSGGVDDFLAGAEALPEALTSDSITLDQSDGMDKYLRAELAALVEGMVRAYARRRLRPLLEQFVVLEVEREGWWKLGAVDLGSEIAELYFASRHDALLLERQTNSLYLQSYKTTGSWDRRKEMDAQVDQQGLSEAVDVENRMREAWELLEMLKKDDRAEALSEMVTIRSERVDELVSSRVAEWLSSQPEPPRILGVRYEYLHKGQRRQDKKDPELPGRYVQDSPLIRAYSQDGITAADRRWSWTYEWWELSGKSRRLDYRSWKKQPVWKYLSIAEWIDMLDRGEVQPDAYDEDGYVMDVLAEQFVEPITVYRNSDDMRDWLEQTQAQEIQVAKDAEEVRRARAEGGEMAERSALNRLFGQSRRACSYPGKCSFWEVCYGGDAIRRNPESSGLYTIRIPNHPIELEMKEVEEGEGAEK